MILGEPETPLHKIIADSFLWFIRASEFLAASFPLSLDNLLLLLGN